MSEDSAVILSAPGEEDYTEWNELAALSSESGEISIRVSESRSEAYLFVLRGAHPSGFTHFQLVKLLKENGINYGICEPEIEEALATLVNPGDRIHALLVAKGVDPLHGENAKIEYLFDLNSPGVCAGQELVRIAAETSGEDGKDVFGKPITCQAGKPLTLKLVEGVDLEEGKYLATVDGYAVLGYNCLAVSETFEVKISPDANQAELSFKEEGIAKQDITAYLGSLGIDSGLQKEVIEAVANVGVARGRIVAEGVAAEPSVDANIEYFYQRSGTGALKQGADGKIDYKNQSNYVMVDAGQKLIRVTPAKRGTKGINVFGVVDNVAEAKDIKIRAGENVSAIEEDGATVFVCDARGTPILKGGILKVSVDLVVEGDLDLSTGNVFFEGDIRITGHVLDGFEVHTKKNLSIGGTVGAAVLHADGDIRVNSGFKGKRQSTVHCGGDLHAKYIDDLTLEVDGTVTADTEIVGCTISNRGAIECPNGVLVGGDVVCLGGINVGTLGSDAYIRTSLLIGEDYKLLRYREEWDPKLAKMVEEEEDIAEKLATIKRNPQMLKRMTVEMKMKFKHMLLRAKEIQENRAAVTEKIAAMQADALEKKKAEIRVEKMLYPGTYIRIGFSEQEIKSEMRGPLLITEDLETQMISIQSIS